MSRYRRRGTRSKAKAAGYRSGYEQRIIEALKVPYEYETEKIPFVVPETKHVYTPDLIFEKKDGSKMYVELKGMLDYATRVKLLNIKRSNPDMDLRLCFQTPNCPTRKGSKITHIMWGRDNGFKCCGPEIDPEWLKEIKKTLDVPKKRK